MDSPLHDAWAKLSRAKLHLHKLDKAVSAFLRSNPYPISKDVDAEGREFTFRVKVAKALPVTEFALLIGDCVHNARSALDYFAWQLSERDSGTKPDDTTTQFPIFRKRELFDKFSPKMVHRIGDRGRAFIKWVQPYRRRNPDGHPLWVLHTLDIADKHKLLAVTASILSQHSLTIRTPPWSKGEHMLDFRVGAFKDGAIVAVVKFWNVTRTDPRGPANPKVDVNGKIATGVVFSDGVLPFRGINPVVPTLAVLIVCVEGLLRNGERLLFAEPRPS